MNLSTVFRALVLSQVILGLVAFAIAVRNPVLLLIIGGLAALSWAVSEGPTGKPLPHWAVMIGAVGAVVWLLIDLVRQHGNVALALGHFIMWLQVIMLYGKKSNREYGELLVLSVLMMVSASAFSGELTYGLMLIAYCVLTLFTLLVFHLKVTTDALTENNRRAAPDPELVSHPKAVRGRGFKWHFQFTALTVGAIAAAIGALAFMFIPRSGDPDAGAEFGLNKAQSKTGFSTRVTMADAGPGEAANKDPVLHFYLENASGRIDPENNPGFKYLLRGAVLDNFEPNSGTWQRSQVASKQDIRVEMKPEGLMLLPRVPSGEPMLTIIQIRRRDEPNLFTLWSPDWVYLRDAKQITYNPIDRQLAINDSKLKSFEYRVNSLTNDDEAKARYQLNGLLAARKSGEPTDEFLKKSENLPAESSKTPLRPAQIGRYARDFRAKTNTLQQFTLDVLKSYGLSRNPERVRDDNDPLIAAALSDYLEKNYSYQTDAKAVPRGKDPIMTFLTETKSGHCERFAGSLAGMARSIGMTARVVTGYMVVDYNSVGNYYLARQSNAHAWVEIYDAANENWITFDPTPPATIDSLREPITFIRWASDLYEHLQYRWVSTVITYDSVARERVLTDVGGTITDIGSHSSWMGSLSDWFSKRLGGWRLDRFTLILIVIISAALVMAVILLLRILYVRRQRLIALQLTALPRAQRRQLASRLKFYLQMLDMLERHGYNRPSWQSPFGYAKDLAKRSPAISRPVVQLTELFYEIRFGYRDLDQERKDKISTTLKELEDALFAKA